MWLVWLVWLLRRIFLLMLALFLRPVWQTAFLLSPVLFLSLLRGPAGRQRR